METQTEKERTKFISVRKEEDIRSPTYILTEEQQRAGNSRVEHTKTSGLKGGARTTNSKENHINKQLKLLNTGTDCFVNSVIQMIRNTEYASFIKIHLPTLLANVSVDTHKLGRLLTEIYANSNVENEVSAAPIRTLVANHSGKSYFDDNTQQDAEEFFRTLEFILSEELNESEEFQRIRNLHWGTEEHIRKFLDNTETGICQRCGESPAKENIPFLILKLKNIPRTNSSVTLCSIIQSHFAEGTEMIEMRCSNCCEQQGHQSNGVSCPQTGICRPCQTV